MGLLLDLLNLLSYLPAVLRPDEQQIAQNIYKLRNQRWYQELYAVEKYRHLIIHEGSVRKAIGRLNTKKLDELSYQYKAQRKIEKALKRTNAAY